MKKILVSLLSLVSLSVFANCEYGDKTCLYGYVWRGAAPSDYVCVTESERSAVEEQNRMAHGRRQGWGEYGYNTCYQGYVWRNAFPGDYTCVTPYERDIAASQNQNAEYRRDRQCSGQCLPGNMTCRQGYVWRAAAPHDYVCVTPWEREEVQRQNSLAWQRRQGWGEYGPNTCRPGFVWREAFQGDFTCVTREEKNRVQNQNANARRNTQGCRHGHPDFWIN